MITELIPLPSDAYSLNETKQITSEIIEKLEKNCLILPQVECPVIHRYGPGIYIREVSIPAGTFSIGHYQKQEHFNVLLKGRVTMFDEDGKIVERTAPFIYVGKPGRKVGFIHEDMVWQNIYATEETDVEKLEEMFLIKSVAWQENDSLQKDMLQIIHKVDRDDYKKMLEDVGVTHEIARTQSENEEDQIPFPEGSYKVMVSDSTIEGKGLFATAGISAGETIAPARIAGKRTPAGRFTNHSIHPNAFMLSLPNGDINLVSLESINGCRGGNPGDEITIDYRQAIGESMKYLDNKPCQE